MKLNTYLALVAWCLLGAAGCGGKETYGKIDASAPAVQVKDILLSDAYHGKVVRLSGKIALQCASTGCWFFLDDGTGRMFVDLQGLGLGLPQRGGRKARVSGKVTVDREGQATLSAQGLEVS